MHFSTISAAAVAALAFLATPAVGAAMPAADLAARSAELDARAEQLEARAALLVCQFGGDKGCSAEVSTDVPDDGNVGKILIISTVRCQKTFPWRLLQLHSVSSH